MIVQTILIIMTCVGVIEILAGTLDTNGKRQLKKVAEKAEKKRQ